jgi:hypothetical protein
MDVLFFFLFFLFFGFLFFLDFYFVLVPLFFGFSVLFLEFL